MHIPTIQEITGDVTLTNAAGVTDLVLPDLQSIGGRLQISGNEALRNVSLGRLESAGNKDSGSDSGSGGLDIRENNALDIVDLGSLKDVDGGLSLEGGFRFVAHMYYHSYHSGETNEMCLRYSLSISSLKDVTGRTSITGAKLPCGLFDRLAAAGDFQGSYSCINDGHKGLSPGAKAGIAIGVIIAVLLVGLGIWLIVVPRRRRAAAAAMDEEGHDEKMGYSDAREYTGPETTGAGSRMMAGLLKIPRKPFPSKHPENVARPRPVDMLDGRMIYEAPTGVRSPTVYELDAGPQSRHQIPINHE